MDYKEKGASELDKLCHRVYDHQKQNGLKVFGECHRCEGPLYAYYCEERLYLIACEECGTIVLTKACSPQVAANLTIVEKDANAQNLRVSKILARAEAAEARAEKAERERDAAVKALKKAVIGTVHACDYCKKNDPEDYRCEHTGFTGCFEWEWNGK